MSDREHDAWLEEQLPGMIDMRGMDAAQADAALRRAQAARRPDLLPINNEGWNLCMTHEERILDHCIMRLRSGQPAPIYRLGDRQFDSVVKRQRLGIQQVAMPDGTRAPCTEYAVGATVISIVAGGPLMPEVQIDLVEGSVDLLSPVEHYVRREVELSSGIVCAIGLEYRPSTDRPAAELAVDLKAWCHLAADEIDPAEFALKYKSFLVEHHPDRYWFVEVWGKQDDAAFYQIIQRPPWRTGGFHP